mmetsp:Transcript_13612/g.34742  ORF Transcript_13612/g.34742 Transcript_13612/m.34742 type:complete len:122 (-) Transcript_13612:106-471(-)
MKNKGFIYHLESANGMHYLGRSRQPRKRIGQHFRGHGSRWTRQHHPVRVVSVRRERSATHEREATLRLMVKHGVDAVRGGSWCQRELPLHVRPSLERQVRAKRQKRRACIRAARAKRNASE